MAFPQVQGTPSQGGTGTATSHVVTMPAGIVAGELLLAFITCDLNPTLSATGWTKLGQQADLDGSSNLAVFYKTAAGSDTMTVTTGGANEPLAWTVYRISGWSAVTGTSTSGDSTNANPPSHTPAGGSADYLWFVACGIDQGVLASAAPTNYTNRITQAPGASGGGLTTARRELAAASEDPGAFTSSTEAWAAWTVAVAPAATATQVELGNITETTTVNALTVQKTKTLANVTEATTVNAVTVQDNVTLGNVTESTSLFALDVDTAGVNLGTVTETTTVNALAVVDQVTLGTVTETATVNPVTTTENATLGLITETTTVNPVTVQIVVLVTLGLITETTTLNAVTVQDHVTLGTVTQTTTLFTIDEDSAISLALITETTTVNPITAAKSFGSLDLHADVELVGRIWGPVSIINRRAGRPDGTDSRAGTVENVGITGTVT